MRSAAGGPVGDAASAPVGCSAPSLDRALGRVPDGCSAPVAATSPGDAYEAYAAYDECDWAEAHLLLGAFVLGGLDDEDRARFTEHTALCARCRTELAQAGGVRAALALLAAPRRT